MLQGQYYKTIVFDDLPTKEAAFSRLDATKNNSTTIKLERAKILLITMILDQETNLSNQDLMVL